jgi:photosystem II PsbM protein
MSPSKMFVLATVAMCLVSASAFVAPVSFTTQAASALKMSATSNIAKAAAAAVAPALLSAPAFADSSIISQLPTEMVGLEVQFGAYLAVLLGTFVPVAFLVLLYIQSETRKAGEIAGEAKSGKKK